MSPGQALPAPARLPALRVVRLEARASAAPRVARRPAWSLVYAIVSLTIAGLATSDLVLPEGPARSLADALTFLGGIGLIRLWLGANRRSLAGTDARDQPGLQKEDGDA
jgi:hypothetical protein